MISMLSFYKLSKLNKKNQFFSCLVNLSLQLRFTINQILRKSLLSFKSAYTYAVKEEPYNSQWTVRVAVKPWWWTHLNCLHGLRSKNSSKSCSQSDKKYLYRTWLKGSKQYKSRNWRNEDFGPSGLCQNTWRRDWWNSKKGFWPNCQ